MEQLWERSKRYIDKCREHRKIIRTAAVIFTVIAAVVFFGGYGKKEEIPVQFPQGGGETALIDEEGETVLHTEGGEEKQALPEKIYVDVSGQVKNPGVYQVEEGSRIFEVIDKAGGLLSSAQTDQVNQAETVIDGQKIVIPKEGEDAEPYPGASPGSSGGLININTADSAALQELSGVGPATAEKIIDYRNRNGKFHQKEDLKNVSGIGEKTFEKLQDKITI